MAEIKPYEQQVTAGGQTFGRAESTSFGASADGFGAGAQSLSAAIQQKNETQDITNVHVNMAKARAEWTQTLKDRANQAQPGDETFAPSLMKDMEGYFQKASDSAQTPSGKQLMARMAAEMTSEIGRAHV